MPPLAHLERGELPPGAGGDLHRVLRLIRRLCAPLAYRHGEGLVHCDLKPANVLVRPGGQPVLVDFGVTAHFAGRTGREALDVRRAFTGTAACVSPEQLRGELARRPRRPVLAGVYPVRAGHRSRPVPGSHRARAGARAPRPRSAPALAPGRRRPGRARRADRAPARQESRAADRLRRRRRGRDHRDHRRRRERHLRARRPARAIVSVPPPGAACRATRALCDQALAIQDDIGDRIARLNTLVALASIGRRVSGDLDAARALLDEADALGASLDSAYCKVERGHIGLALGRSGAVFLARARAIGADCRASSSSDLTGFVDRLAAAQDAFETDAPMVRGDSIAALPPGLARWLTQVGALAASPA